MNNILLLVALLVGIVCGWFAGSWSGRDAKASLAKVEESARLLEIEHKKQVGELNAQVTTLVTDYKRDKQAQDDAHARQVSELDATLAGAKGRVAELEKARNDSQAALQRLKNERGTATTPQSRQKIDASIAAQEVAIAQQSVQISSQQCLDIPVPSDVLASWNRKQP